jgi:hypothetical protein
LTGKVPDVRIRQAVTEGTHISAMSMTGSSEQDLKKEETKTALPGDKIAHDIRAWKEGWEGSQKAFGFREAD